MKFYCYSSGEYSSPVYTQPVFTCSKSTMEALKQYVKSIETLVCY